MKKVPLLPRPVGSSLVVLSDVRPGEAPPANDLTDLRTYIVGEQIEVRLDRGPLRQESLEADVVAVNERVLVARARHSVYSVDEHRRHIREPLVHGGDEFEVERGCVYSVVKMSMAEVRGSGSFTLPPLTMQATGEVHSVPLPEPVEAETINVMDVGNVRITIPPGIETREERLKVAFHTLIVAALRVVDMDLEHVSPADFEVLRRIAGDSERRMRFGDLS